MVSVQGVKVFSSHSDWITSIAWSEQSEHHVLTSSYDRTAKLWDTRTVVPLHTLEGHTDKVQLLCQELHVASEHYLCCLTGMSAPCRVCVSPTEVGLK